MPHNPEVCQGCPLLISCLADPDFVFRECAKCRTIRYGKRREPDLSNSNNDSFLITRTTDLLWEENVPSPLPGCFPERRVEQMLSRREGWMCHPCRIQSMIKSFDFSGFGGMPKVVSDPVVSQNRIYLIGHSNPVPLSMIRLKIEDPE